MKAEERKKHILECAKGLFSKKGYHATQISDIIKKAKIARGTIYQYFKNKDDIFITLLEEYFIKWQTEVVEKHSDEINMHEITAVDFLRFRMKSTLAFFANDHELCNIVLRMGLGLHDELARVNKQFEKDIQRIIIKDLELGRAAGNIRPSVNIELTANILAGALLRVSYYYFVQERKLFKETSIDIISDELTELFSKGLFIQTEGG